MQPSARPVSPAVPRDASERALPSGRSVVVRIQGGQEELEVRSPTGEVEVRIALTDAGPVVSLRGARLELESADDLSLRCRRLEVDAAEAVEIRGREMKLETEDDLRLKGKVIHLN